MSVARSGGNRRTDVPTDGPSCRTNPVMRANYFPLTGLAVLNDIGGTALTRISTALTRADAAQEEER